MPKNIPQVEGFPAYNVLRSVIKGAPKIFKSQMAGLDELGQRQVVSSIREFAITLGDQLDPEACWSESQIALATADLCRLAAKSRDPKRQEVPRKLVGGDWVREGLDYAAFFAMVNGFRLECRNCLHPECPHRDPLSDSFVGHFKKNGPLEGEHAKRLLKKIVDNTEKEFPHSWSDHRDIENKDKLMEAIQDYSETLAMGVNEEHCLTDNQVYHLKNDLLRLAKAHVFGNEVGARGIGYASCSFEKLGVPELLMMINGSRLNCQDCLKSRCPHRDPSTFLDENRKKAKQFPRKSLWAVRAQADHEEGKEEIARAQAEEEAKKAKGE
jgi:hypothetical protein